MSSRHARRRAAAILVVASVLGLTPGSVAAHAELATMTPADRETVSAPSTIVATFTEELDPSGSSLAVVDASGTVIAQGGAVSAATKKQMSLDLSSVPLEEETYTIRWTSKSADDGDLDRGTTTFTVSGGPSAPVRSGASASPSASAAASVAGTESPAASPHDGSGAPASSTDALVPIIVALIVVAGFGAWLLRRRSRAGR